MTPITAGPASSSVFSPKALQTGPDFGPSTAAAQELATTIHARRRKRRTVKTGIEMTLNGLQDVLNHRDLFSELAAETELAFQSLQETFSYPANTTLFVQGQIATGVFVVLKGEVKLSEARGDSGSAASRLAGPGEILGILATVAAGRYGATAETLEPSEIGLINDDSFSSFLRDHHTFTYRLVQLLSHGLNTTFDQLRTGLAESTWKT